MVSCIPKEYTKMLVKTYDATVQEYVKHEFNNKMMKKHYHNFLSFLPKNSRVLDAGCGPGQAAKRFSKKGHEVVGIDFSKKMIAFAKKAVPNARFLVRDVATFSSKKVFDGIWAAFILVHIPCKKHVKVLKQFNKMLSENGILFLGLLEGKGEKIIPEPYNRNYNQYFVYSPKKEAKENLKKAGFNLLSYESEKYSEEGDIFRLSFLYAKKLKNKKKK